MFFWLFNEWIFPIQVLRGGDGMAGFAVRDPAGQIVYPYQWRTSADYQDQSAAGGYYSVCIDNQFSRFASKLVNLYLTVIRWRSSTPNYFSPAWVLIESENSIFFPSQIWSMGQIHKGTCRVESLSRKLYGETLTVKILKYIESIYLQLLFILFSRQRSWALRRT